MSQNRNWISPAGPALSDSTPEVLIRRHPSLPGHDLLETSMSLPRPLLDVFDFFADASNLEAITPPWLHFRIVSPRPIEMRPGTLIDYQLRLHGWPLRWRTEISTWEPPHRFVDRQVRGPYRLWEHEHNFAEAKGGTSATDRVTYRAVGGMWVHLAFVRRDLRRIFAYRASAIARLLQVGLGG